MHWLNLKYDFYDTQTDHLTIWKYTLNISRILYKALKSKVSQNYNTLNKNNKTLSIFAMVAVFAMGVAVYAHQNAAATIISDAQDAPRDAIRDAQNALKSLESANQNPEVAKAIEEGQEGLNNATSALDNATSVLNNLPGESSTSPLGQNSGSLNQGTNSLGNSTSLPTGFQ